MEGSWKGRDSRRREQAERDANRCLLGRRARQHDWDCMFVEFTNRDCASHARRDESIRVGLGKSEMELSFMNRSADTSPTFVSTQKTLSEREDERDEPQSDTQLIDLGIKFPSLTKTIPNVEVSNCHTSLMVLNVTMVQPALVGHGTRVQRGQQATLRERVVTDWFGRTQRLRRHWTTITVTNQQQIPHPCQLYSSALCPPHNPPRRHRHIPSEVFEKKSTFQSRTLPTQTANQNIGDSTMVGRIPTIPL
ncbi:hypothetical protein BLNAU_8567 [Blattamonas nauphoetae]|uniref:Uncharacterized protein n=1 Tax=Blattamonas nauphoetae TaxID=2049346 RepID=A0ABQ9XYG3_9EUKA|nr:hypothetical protein BLNAU_8567 [Blattamonas nauphoetae]